MNEALDSSNNAHAQSCSDDFTKNRNFLDMKQQTLINFKWHRDQTELISIKKRCSKFDALVNTNFSCLKSMPYFLLVAETIQIEQTIDFAIKTCRFTKLTVISTFIRVSWPC